MAFPSEFEGGGFFFLRSFSEPSVFPIIFLRTISFANGLIDVFPGHLKHALHSLLENHYGAFVQDRWMRTAASK